jgi:MFS family permease
MTWRVRNPRVVLGLLTTLNLLNYLDRFVISAVIAPIREEFGLSGFVAGLPATIFLIGYFATSPIFGILGDRASPAKRNGLIALGVGVWSAATAGSGLATGTASLLATRAVVGVGEASYATLSPKLIDEIAPPTRTGRWMAVFSAATSVGGALGFLLGGAVLQARGWRDAFFVAGLPGLTVALLCLLIETPADVPGARPERAVAARAEACHAGVVATARALAGVPIYRRFVLGYSAFTFALGGFAYWAPSFPHERFGMEAGRASILVGATSVVAGVIGTLLGGMLSERAVAAAIRDAEQRAGAPLDDVARDQAVARGNMRVCFWSGALAAPFGALAIAAPSPALFFVGLFVCELGAFLQNGPSNITILRSAPAAIRASAMAVAIFTIHALGDLWSPPLLGLASDLFSLPVGMMAVPVMFGVSALTWLGPPAELKAETQSSG